MKKGRKVENVWSIGVIYVYISKGENEFFVVSGVNFYGLSSGVLCEYKNSVV